MAFLDNSGDIILDAVLTDAGRKRLAQGDGSFRIAKFALGDDEIDYGLFRGSNHPEGAHPSGSAYYDLEIMQTPVLEAFTNNTSVLKYKLLSMPQTNLLYLPEIRLNDVDNTSKAVILTLFSGEIDSGMLTSLISTGTGIFLLAADEETKSILDANVAKVPTHLKEDSHIRVDQGINTDEISYKRDISPDLKETQYIIQADHRLVRLTDFRQNTLITESYIDDDMQASYYVTLNSDANIVTVDEANRSAMDTLSGANEIIAGPFGTKIRFNLKPSEEVATSTSLFSELGGGSGSSLAIDALNFFYIDTNVRITGATTGSSIDIPVRILKNY